MHETLQFNEIDSIGSSPDTYEATNATPPYIDPELDDSELFNLVAANAGVIVRFGGAEMTLGEAMWQIPITRENLSGVISLVYELLANRMEEKLDPEEDDDKQQEEAAEEDGNPEDGISAKTKQPEPGRPDKTEKKPKMKAVGRLPETAVRQEPPTAGQAEASAVSGPKKTRPQVVRPRDTDNHFENPGKAAVRYSPAEPETKYVSNNTDKSYIRATAVAESVDKPAPAKIQTIETGSLNDRPEDRPDRPSPAVGVPEAVTAAVYTPKPGPPADETRAAVLHGPQPFDLPADTETVAETEGSAVPGTDYERVISAELSVGAAGEDMEPLADEPVLTPTGDDLKIISPADFIDAGLAADYPEAIETEHAAPELSFEAPAAPAFEIFGSVLQPDAAVTIPHPDLEPVQPVQPEQSVNDEKAGRAADALIRLTEAIEDIEPETAETVSEIIGSIIEVSSQPEPAASQAVVYETETQEELEILFAELFEAIDPEHPPELIEELAALTIRLYPAEAVKGLWRAETADETARDPGTHEIIAQLLAALGLLKKTISPAGALGRSAISLYNHQTAGYQTA